MSDIMSEDSFVKTVCCIGAGYVGGPTMAVLAKHSPRVKFYVADIDKRRIDAWNSDELPIYEPHLDEYIRLQRNKNLFFTTDVEKAIRESEVIFIAVNTPTKNFGHWNGTGYDLSSYEAVSRKIAEVATTSKIVVEKSTIPVRTGEHIRDIFYNSKKTQDIDFEVVSNPEFLAEGTAIKNLEQPDRILIGGLDTPSGKKAVEVVASLYQAWVPDDRIIRTGLWSAELAKLACNAFLAQRISSINSLSALCEKTGADIDQLSIILGSDTRIGPNFLKASVGYGGSCFGKDLLGLVYLCESLNLPEVAEYWRQVIKINDYQKQRFAKQIVQQMFSNMKNKNICILGFAFKKDTADFRESAALDVTSFIVEEGATVFIYDPKVHEAEIKAVFPTSKVNVVSTAYGAALQADAIVILTEWDEFKTLDYQRIFGSMRKPAYFYDGRNIVNHTKLRDIGFKVYAIGKQH